MILVYDDVDVILVGLTQCVHTQQYYVFFRQSLGRLVIPVDEAQFVIIFVDRDCTKYLITCPLYTQTRSMIQVQTHGKPG